MELSEARHRAEDWVAAWNARDLERILAHYTDDVEICSPFAQKRLGVADGIVRGKDALRAYFAMGVKIPGLRFDLVDVLASVNGYAVVYRRETGALVVDAVETDAAGHVRRMVAFYGAATG